MPSVRYFRVPLVACGYKMAGERQPGFWGRMAQQLRRMMELSMLSLEGAIHWKVGFRMVCWLRKRMASACM